VSERGGGLTVGSLSVRFGGVVALEAVDLQVDRGEIVGLVGPNGAGKSTLVNCVGGQLEQSSGSIMLAGVSLDGKRPYRRARLGVGRTFQRVALFPELTVEAHLLLALRAGRGRRARASELADRARPTPGESARIAEVLGLVGLGHATRAAVATLPLGACRLLEIGRALIGDPVILLADEPSSGLDGREAETLAGVLMELPGRGVGVLLVEHDLRLVERVCHRVVVLDLGRVIARGTFATVMADPAVRRAYLGHVA
jgi:branched-chain amino acid transport system ATP-binding protein